MAYRKFTMDTELGFEVGMSGQVIVSCRVEFTYTPGSPETPPAYSHGGLPADPPECEIEAIRIQWREAWVEVPIWLTEKMADDDELYHQFCDYAAEAMADEKAEAMERRAEARRDE